MLCLAQRPMFDMPEPSSMRLVRHKACGLGFAPVRADARLGFPSTDRCPVIRTSAALYCRSMHPVRALLSVVLALTLVIGTSHSVLSSEVQNELPGCHMAMHVTGTQSATPSTCHKCVGTAPCCAVCASGSAVLPMADHAMRLSTKPDVAFFTEPQFKHSAMRPSPPPPKLGDLT
jgi:hypothetical protein